MKNGIVLFLLCFFICCKPKVINDFDEIIHYSITDTISKTQKNNFDFVKLYSGLGTSIKMNQSFEEKLVEFGYLKKNIQKRKIAKINFLLANDLNLKNYESACIPSFGDILILKKNGYLKAIIKICFECEINESAGQINSNFDYETNKFSNYQNLKKVLQK